MDRVSTDQASPPKLVAMADRTAYWQLQMSLWRQSGLSIRSFCRKQNLYEPGFRLWQRAIGATSQVQANHVQLSPTRKSGWRGKRGLTAQRLNNLEDELLRLKQLLADRGVEASTSH
jgi:hypothetical protein